jgi:hypothetical protein
VLALNVLVFNANMEGYYHITNGYDMFATQAMVSVLVLFAFFSTTTVIDYMHSDIYGNRRWRLMAAPTGFNKFILAAICAAVIFSLVTGALLLVAGRLIFSAYVPNLFVTMATVFLLALLGQALGVVLFTFFRKKSQTEAIAMVLGFGMMIMQGGFMGTIDLGVDAINRFFQEFTPFSLGFRAIMYSAALADEPGTIAYAMYNWGSMSLVWRNLGILAAITAVLAVVGIVFKGRRVR